ncbi:MAG: hypothetical protein AAF456_03280 [Planctomycetota bacterium]
MDDRKNQPSDPDVEIVLPVSSQHVDKHVDPQIVQPAHSLDSTPGAPVQPPSAPFPPVPVKSVRSGIDVVLALIGVFILQFSAIVSSVINIWFAVADLGVGWLGALIAAAIVTVGGFSATFFLTNILSWFLPKLHSQQDGDLGKWTIGSAVAFVGTALFMEPIVMIWPAGIAIVGFAAAFVLSLARSWLISLVLVGTGVQVLIVLATMVWLRWFPPELLDQEILQ